MGSFKNYANGFLDETRARGVKEESIRFRMFELEKFECWLSRKENNIKLENVDAAVIQSYLKIRSACKSKNTVAGYMSILRCFGDYLSRQGVWKKNYLKWMMSPKCPVGSHIPKVLKKLQIESLLAESFKQKERIHQYLCPTAFLIMYSLGLRLGEVVSIDFSDWDSKEKRILIRNSKSKFERYVPVPNSVEKCIESYLQMRQQTLIRLKIQDATALFINRNGDRIGKQSLAKLIGKTAKRCGIENFTTHQIRHTCATNLLNNGVTLPEVKMVLGHTCISTTMRYTHIAGPERIEAMKRHPVNQMLEGGLNESR